LRVKRAAEEINYHGKFTPSVFVPQVRIACQPAAAANHHAADDTRSHSVGHENLRKRQLVHRKFLRTWLGSFELL